MQPLDFAAHAEPCFIHVFYPRASDKIAQYVAKDRHRTGAAAAHSSNCRRRKTDVKEISHQLAEPGLRQHLIVKQINNQGGQPGPILHRRIDDFWKSSMRFNATSNASASMCAMFCNNQRSRLRKVKHLSHGIILHHLWRQRSAAV